MNKVLEWFKESLTGYEIPIDELNAIEIHGSRIRHYESFCEHKEMYDILYKDNKLEGWDLKYYEDWLEIVGRQGK